MSIATLQRSPLLGEQGGGAGGSQVPAPLHYSRRRAGLPGPAPRQPERVVRGAGGRGGGGRPPERQRPGVQTWPRASVWDGGGELVGEGMRRAVLLHVQQRLRDDRPLARDVSRGPGFGCQVCP